MDIKQLRVIVNKYSDYFELYQKLEEKNKKDRRAEIFDEVKNQLKRTREILQKITGLAEPKKFFYVSFATLRKHLTPYLNKKHYRLEKYTFNNTQDANEPTITEIRIAMPKKTPFGTLYYRLMSFENDKKNIRADKTMVYLSPLFDKSMWNQILKKEPEIEKIIWSAFNEQLIEDGRIQQLNDFDLEKEGILVR